MFMLYLKLLKLEFFINLNIIFLYSYIVYIFDMFWWGFFLNFKDYFCFFKCEKYIYFLCMSSWFFLVL